MLSGLQSDMHTTDDAPTFGSVHCNLFCMQGAAGIVYWEYQRSVAASEDKKEQERIHRAKLEAEAYAQREVRLPCSWQALA
jgi:hypothetical protein